MTSATFGDFLRQADAHIEASYVTGQDETAHPAAAVRELRRIFATMAGYLDDRVPLHAIEVIGRTDLSPWERAAVEARTAMRRAVSSLSQVLGPGDGPRAEPDGGPAHRLAAAATCLAAGRDLLNTHLSTTPHDHWESRSEWAQAVNSAPVTRALTGEIGRWSRRLAPVAASLASHPAASRGEPVTTRDALQVATHWLWAVGMTIESAQEAEPVTNDDLRLLRAIPAAHGTTRRAPSGDESAAELCAGIMDSAERLRVAVFGTAEQARWAPSATASTWRWTAQAAAVTAHTSELMLRSLATHPSPLVDTTDLMAAADAVGQSWTAWHRVMVTWQELTTETRGYAAAVTTELGDLVLRMGRLAWGDPQWTPANGPKAAPRQAADLADGVNSVMTTVAAVHQAADAFASIADTNLKAVQIADRAGRLYVRTRSLPQGYDVPRPYATAPTDRVQPLLDAYQTAAQASAKAAGVLADLAIAVDAPSTALALAGAASRPHLSQATTPDQDPSAATAPADRPRHRRSGPGPVERAVRDLHVDDPIVLLRAATIDKAAIDLITQANRMSRRPGSHGTNEASATLSRDGSPARLAAKDNPQLFLAAPRANGQQAIRGPGSPRRAAPIRDLRPSRSSRQ